MKKRISKITAGWQKGLLFLTAIVIGTGIYFVAERTISAKSPGVPAVLPRRLPAYIHRPFPLITLPAPNNAQQRTAIEDFQKWIDSLKNDPRGKLIYNHIRSSRPGLLDSAAAAANYYFFLNLFK